VIQSDGETYLQVSVYNSPLMLTAMSDDVFPIKYDARS
jgi:hypothetical protein